VRESIVQLLLFVAVVSATALLVGTIIAGATDLAGSVADDGDRVATELDADVAIVNDGGTDAYDPDAAGGDGGVVLYVKNVGGSTLEPAALEVVLNGTYVTGAETAVVDADRWRAGSVLAVTIPTAVDPGTHRVLVRVHGNEDRLTFEHG
jgi:flagellar protein FlaG